MSLVIVIVILTSASNRRPATWFYWSPCQFCGFASKYPAALDSQWRKIDRDVSAFIRQPKGEIIATELALIGDAERSFGAVNDSMHDSGVSTRRKGFLFKPSMDVSGLDLIAIKLGRPALLDRDRPGSRFIRLDPSGRLVLRPRIPFSALVVSNSAPSCAFGGSVYARARVLVRAGYYCPGGQN